MRLTKKEAKYRTKLVQEGHYNKEEQAILDAAVIGAGLTYKEAYVESKNGKSYKFALEFTMRRLNRAAAKFGASAKEAAAGMAKMGAALKKCITPEMPYCPSCQYGIVVYPEWVETAEDLEGCSCEWICSLQEGKEEECQ